MRDSPAFLNVVHSATGRRWVGPSEAEERLGLAIAQRAGLPEIVGRIMAARGVQPDEAEAHLSPTLRDLMPDPSSIADMDLAAQELAGAVAAGRRIAVFGDYDVDGAASSALLVRWLRALGTTATVYIPDRIAEGYGPTVPAMEHLASSHDLIICVDCGTMGHEPLAAAQAAGAGVIVADHHLPGETLPEARAVVNPNRLDDASGLGSLCAAGVVFMLLVAANRVLRGQGRQVPDLKRLLDLVALATVADVAPLQGLNRAFVRQGLAVMAGRNGAGLRALADAAGMKSAPTSHHLGFLLGPRINAGGRIGEASLGARLLATDDPAEAEAISARLDALNGERRRIEAEVLEAAIAQVEARDPEAPMVWAAGEGWHPGVVGIVASRLKDRYNRPAVVIGFDGATGQGSGRSIEGVDLGASVAALARNGGLVKGGGHQMAAGLTAARDGLEDAMTQLSDALARQGAGTQGPRDLVLDGGVAPGGATLELCELVEKAGPYGAGARAPKFALPDVTTAFLKPVGENHLKLTLQGPAGDRIDAMAFRAVGSPLGDFLSARSGAPFHAAGKLETDDWGGRRRVRLLLEDAAAPA